MGLEFLARVRRSSLGLGAVAALFAATYVAPAMGLAVAAGTAWSIANLWLLQRLIVALTGPRRGEPSTLIRLGLTMAGVLALFGSGALLLFELPAIGLMAGFSVPFAVITLKAAALMLMGSSAWRRFARDPGRTTGVILAVAISLFAMAPLIARATAPARPEPVAATQVAADEPSHGQAGAHETAATHEGEAHEGEEKGPQKFPNLITIIARANPHARWAHFLHRFEAVFFSMLVALILCLVSAAASRNPTMIPGKLQNAVELLVEGLYNFIADIIGKQHAARFVPFLGTLGIYIWCMNLFGLIPFMDSPTSSLNITFALGLIVFLYAQWIGIRGLGPVGYVDHLLGQPRDLTGWALAPLMLPIHVLGELAKPISLSCRLFGNIFGEDMLLVAFVTLGIAVSSLVHVPLGVPLQLPFLLLALLTSTLQAAVFMVLSTIYFLLMLPHDEHGHEHEGAHSHVNSHPGGPS
jgi:F-type H+-transporting ATPase subunit a